MDRCVDVEDWHSMYVVDSEQSPYEGTVPTVPKVKASNDEAVSSSHENTQDDRYNIYAVGGEQPPQEAKALPVKSSNKE